MAALSEIPDPGLRNHFNDLLTREFPRVFNYLLRLVKNRALAEDLTQSAFLKAWAGFRRFDSTRNFTPWIFKIARHTAVDYFRKSREIPDENIGKGTAPGPAQDEQLIQAEQSREIENALSALPPRQQEVVYLYYMEELSLTEVAHLTRHSKRAVISLLQRARKILRPKLLPFL